ncbi:MAG TPA: hypothetical protein DHU55_13545 [Blastocatellia bacterium]|nr:hypothetical protein [Blastocatellia bacterium]
MAEYLDVTNWARREVFEFFLGFDKPYFNICTRLDVTNLLKLLRQGPKVRMSLAYHYFALRVANEIEPFRYRLRQGKVFVHDVIHGGTTVLLPNENFTLLYARIFRLSGEFREVHRSGRARGRRGRVGGWRLPTKSKRRQDSLHDVALGFVYQLFARAQLGTRGFHSEDCIREVYQGERPHTPTDLRRGASRANGWLACWSIPDPIGRSVAGTGKVRRVGQSAGPWPGSKGINVSSRNAMTSL